MGRHEAPDEGAPDPVVAAAITQRPEGGGAHAAEEPESEPLGWMGPERDGTSALGWPGDLPR